MHERDALTKRRVKHGFALFHFHLDAHRLEPNLVNLRVRHHFGLVVVVANRMAGASFRSPAKKGRPNRPLPPLFSLAKGYLLTPVLNSPRAPTPHRRGRAATPRRA